MEAKGGWHLDGTSVATFEGQSPPITKGIIDVYITYLNTINLFNTNVYG